MTTWLPVPDWPEYEASDEGAIRSVDRIRSDGRHMLRGRVLRPGLGTTGYLNVAFCRDGKLRTQRVHRVIASAHLGVCPEGMEVLHIDGDRTNNRADNLRYGTRSENNRDQVRHGTFGGRERFAKK